MCKIFRADINLYSKRKVLCCYLTFCRYSRGFFFAIFDLNFGSPKILLVTYICLLCSRAPENLKLAGNFQKVAVMCGLRNDK